jgi:adenosylhomocysteine nucleosidase
MRLAVVSAMAEEQAGLAEALASHAALREGRVSLSFSLCGIGKVAAAMTVTRIVERERPDAIVFTGVAGGLGPGVHRGDVVVGSQFLQHDLDASPIFPRYEVPLTGRSRFDADQALTARLVAAASRIGSGWGAWRGAVHHGLIVSGDRFVSTTAEALALQDRLPEALAVEMEGAAIAQVCHAYGMPYAVVRSISDRADDEAHGDFNTFIAEVAARASQQIITQLVDDLALG